MDIYSLAAVKADELEKELKQLGRWMDKPLPDESYVDMGAFGSNTMTFEQWIQFVLIERIREIVTERSEIPQGSNLGVYGIRYFDGDSSADRLLQILNELDQLVNNLASSSPTVSLGDEKIPEVLFSLAEVLPQFELENLESQLQTFDTFLQFLSPKVRPGIYDILMKAAAKTINPACKKIIEQAARDIADGKRAAAPYNHEEAMKKYQEEHRKNFPNLT
jgi:uncharacterized protein YqcC (DUF446 family)